MLNTTGTCAEGHPLKDGLPENSNNTMGGIHELTADKSTTGCAHKTQEGIHNLLGLPLMVRLDPDSLHSFL